MNDDATEQVTLDELIGIGIDAARQALHTADVAVVVSYDRTAGTVECSFPIGRMIPDGSGNFVTEPVQNMKDIPVCFPRCAAFALTFPLVAGDSGIVVFAMRNISAWRTTGAAGSPGDVGTHTPDGAVFIPGVLPDAKPPRAADASNMVVGSETDGKGRIEILPAGGHLGAGASKGIVRKGDATTGHVHGNGAMTGTITGTANLVTGVVTGTCVLTAGNTASATDTMDGCSATWKAID